MIERGQKSNPKEISSAYNEAPNKIPGPNINPQKVSCPNFITWMHCNFKQSQNKIGFTLSERTTRPAYSHQQYYPNRPIVLNTRKNPCLNQGTQKNTCQIFQPMQNYSGRENFKPHKIDHPCYSDSGVPAPFAPWAPLPISFVHSSATYR